MTKTNYSNKTQTRHVLTLIVISLLCVLLCFSAACGKPVEKPEDPKYNYTEEDDGIIKNADFSYGTLGNKLTSFPKTSPTGWSLSKTASSKSGVVDVTPDGWKELMNNLYSDNGILEYMKIKENFTEADVIKKIKEEKGNDDTPTNKEIKDYIVKNYFNKDGSRFTNPSARPGSEDTKVYMLNNYKNRDTGYGVVQSVASTSTVKLNKGEFAKVSLWIKTANIVSVYGEDEGANITIRNNFNGKSQSSFVINNIITDEWKEFSFYIKADEVYDTDFILSLGLGYDTIAVEGTAYFDDITVSHLTASEYATAVEGKTVDEYNMAYNSEDKINVKANTINDHVVLYDMSLNMTAIAGYVEDAPFSTSYSSTDYYDYTKSSSGGKGNPFPTSNAVVTGASSDDLVNAPYGIDSGIKLTLKDASYTITLKKDANNFSVKSENYAAVSFFIKNNLSQLSNTTITVDVFDVNGAELEKRPAVAKFDKVDDEWQKCTIIVKNNFDKDSFTNEREFYIDIVVGPADVKTANIIDYATGSVVITDPVIASGATYQYKDEKETIETDNYQYYTLLDGTASGKTALYAGYNEDYHADEADTEIYSMVVSPSDMGVILNNPAKSKDYKGIVSDHGYINPDSDNFDVNKNAKAGLINSKYLDNYAAAFPELATNFAKPSVDEIQPLMIYNENATSYGYIGDTISVAKSSYAKVSLDVRVTGSAKAYIYLVDVSKANKDVMSIDKITVNTDGFNKIDNKEYTDLKFEFVVDSSMMKENGWLTVEFYLATGNLNKDFRLEMWNGSRDGLNKSTGYIFFNNPVIKTSGAFTEPAKWLEAFSSSNNPLYAHGEKAFKADDLLLYQRELTADEIKFNKTAEPDKVITYKPTYVWAKNDSIIYGVLNTVEPVVVNPFDKPVEEEEDKPVEDKKDPSAFWMSFSSILLIVALVGAIIALIVKYTRRNKRKYADDAKSHYTIKSRTPKQKSSKKEEVKEDVEDQSLVDLASEPEEEKVEEKKEETLDDYVYGDVQDFGDNKDDDKKE